MARTLLKLVLKLLKLELTLQDPHPLVLPGQEA